MAQYPNLCICLQNLALNIAEKGFPISVYNRSGDKTDAAVARAQKEGLTNLRGFKELKDFVASLEKPRYVNVPSTQITALLFSPDANIN